MSVLRRAVVAAVVLATAGAAWAQGREAGQTAAGAGKDEPRAASAAAVKGQPAAGVKRDAPPRADGTGMQRLGADWPAWLRVGLLYRGRIESARPITGKTTAYDGYYLNRLRLSAALVPASWFQVVAQVQDTETLGYTTAPAPRGMSGGFDLRQGYVEVGRRGPRGLVVAGGRAELTLGEGRLVASSDWGNSSRTYDLGRVSAFLPGVKVDVVRAAPVDMDPGRFDRAKPGEYFWGGYASFDRLPGLKVADAYVFQKANSVVTGELGSRGDGRVYTYGARIAAPAGKTLSADFEGALQRGHLAADSVSGWAAHAGVAWTPAGARGKPRVALGYSFASGDDDPKDGIKRTFDQMYASNHARFGLADLIAWRNMHAIEARVELAPSKKLKVTGIVNRLLLATTTDGWYGSSGPRVVLNPKATSRDIGWEPDVIVTYSVSKEIALGAGLGVLLPGDYVRQSTTLDRYWYPYVTWTYKF